jgi:hypothetical protein
MADNADFQSIFAVRPDLIPRLNFGTQSAMLKVRKANFNVGRETDDRCSTKHAALLTYGNQLTGRRRRVCHDWMNAVKTTPAFSQCQLGR